MARFSMELQQFTHSIANEIESLPSDETRVIEMAVKVEAEGERLRTEVANLVQTGLAETEYLNLAEALTRLYMARCVQSCYANKLAMLDPAYIAKKRAAALEAYRIAHGNQAPRSPVYGEECEDEIDT